MIVIMQIVVKLGVIELSALDYVLLIMNCIPPFTIYAELLQSTSKIIRNNFRGYFKIGVQRESWIYFTFTTIHGMTSITMSMRWSKLQKQKDGLFFCNLRIFLFVCYITIRSLCRISIVIKLSGFWISSTFFNRIACSQKFCRFVTINKGGCGFWFLILINTNSYLSVSTNFWQHHLFCEPSFV